MRIYFIIYYISIILNTDFICNESKNYIKEVLIPTYKYPQDKNIDIYTFKVNSSLLFPTQSTFNKDKHEILYNIYDNDKKYIINTTILEEVYITIYEDTREITEELNKIIQLMKCVIYI